MSKPINTGSYNLCPWCHTYVRQNNAGDYYHEKACEALWCLKQLKDETDPERIAVLKEQLERARYVGD